MIESSDMLDKGKVSSIQGGLALEEVRTSLDPH
jgi:hypothetical protein